MPCTGMLFPNRWAKPEQHYAVDAISGCWIWQGSCTRGYPRFKYRGRSYAAHRFVYERTKGHIPDGLTLDHLCRNRSCVNPDHLEPVTQTENVRRGVRTKVSDETVSYIRSVQFWPGIGRPYRAAGQKTVKGLARELGIPATTITRIRDGQDWR